jgi:FkbM family methyltransferase
MRDPIVPPPRDPPHWRDRILTLFRRRRWRGFVRLYDLLKPIPGRRSLRVATRYGSQFFLTPWDSVDAHVIAEGFYESEVIEAVRPELTAGAVLWVVGANFGLHALTAKWLAPDATVVAFEPSPAMAARLLEHSELNGLAVNLQAYALAAEQGVEEFFTNTSGNPGMSTLHPASDYAYDQRFAVATVAAATVLERGLAPAPRVIIIDAEGAEAQILRGFGAHLANPHLRRIVFEAPNDFLTRREPAELDSLLREAGFSWRRLERREATAHTLSNFVAVRAEPPGRAAQI